MNNLIIPKTNRKLTEKQQSFLDNLIQTGGDPKLSAELAGYSGNHYQVIQTLKEEKVQIQKETEVVTQQLQISISTLGECVSSDLEPDLELDVENPQLREIQI